jgi:glycosyltransferase involved in cell wall biosynthesis
LVGNVDFIRRMPQDEFLRLYDSHDLLLFPSLHDSSSCVVLEALSHGMPVACLDCGGPKDIVTPHSGIIVSTGGLTTSQVAVRLADEIYEALSSPPLLARLSAGAIARANEFLLPGRVTKLYEEAWRAIGSDSIAMAGAVDSSANPVDRPVPAKTLLRRSPHLAD